MKKRIKCIDYCATEKNIGVTYDVVTLIKGCSDIKEATLKLRDAIKEKGKKVTVYTSSSQKTENKDLFDFEIAFASMCHILGEKQDKIRTTFHLSGNFKNIGFIIDSHKDQNLDIEVCDDKMYFDLRDALDKGDTLKFFAHEFFDNKTKLYEWA